MPKRAAHAAHEHRASARSPRMHTYSARAPRQCAHECASNTRLMSTQAVAHVHAQHLQRHTVHEHLRHMPTPSCSKHASDGLSGSGRNSRG
eukprot:406538-Alexandrium_andersonii.AAC.2